MWWWYIFFEGLFAGIRYIISFVLLIITIIVFAVLCTPSSKKEETAIVQTETKQEVTTETKQGEITIVNGHWVIDTTNNESNE